MDFSDWMDEALVLAERAALEDEVPIGAVVVLEGQVIGRGYNQKVKTGNVTRHAEIVAIEDACAHLGDWRLEDCVLISTLEPCPMCAGAILQSRLSRVVYGAKDLKWGACGTVTDITRESFNHHTVFDYREDKRCATLLKLFFRDLRSDGR